MDVFMGGDFFFWQKLKITKKNSLPESLFVLRLYHPPKNIFGVSTLVFWKKIQSFQKQRDFLLKLIIKTVKICLLRLEKELLVADLLE